MLEKISKSGEKVTIADALVEECIITEQIKAEVLAETDEEKGNTFEKLLIDKGYMTEEQMVMAISGFLGIGICRVNEAEFDPYVVKEINREFAEKNCCIPMCFNHEYSNEYNNGELLVVTDNPRNPEVINTLGQALGVTVVPLVAPRTEILKKIEELYGDSKGTDADEKNSGAKISDTETDRVVRRAAKEDIPGILKLLVQVDMVHHKGRPDLFKGPATKYNETELEGIIADESTPVFVLTDPEGNVKGHAFAVHKQVKDSAVITDIRTLYVDDICVDESCRGQGIGRLLYDAVKDYAKTQGFYNITLNVWNCNPSAMKFYESLGLAPQKVCMEEIL